MDAALQIKAGQLVSELSLLLSGNTAPINSRYQDDCAWSLKYLRDSEIIGKFTQLLAILQTNESQAINDLPYTSILDNSAFMPRSIRNRDVKGVVQRIGGYGDKLDGLAHTIAEKESAANAAANAALAVKPKIDRTKEDRRKEYQMRPLAISMYALPRGFMQLPERMLNILITFSQYAHAIKGLIRAPIGVEIKYALERLYREELTIGKYSQEHHRHVFRGEDIAEWPNKVVVAGGVVNMCATPYLVGLGDVSDKLACGEIYKPLNNFVWQGDELINVRGIYSTNSIRARLNVFTGGLLDMVVDSRCYITGSCIPACAVRNPLELHYYEPLAVAFEHDDAYTTAYWAKHTAELRAYFWRFYSGSDIDIIVDCTDDNEFDNIVAKAFVAVHDKLAAERGSVPTLDNIRIMRETSYLSYRLSIIGSWMPCMLQFFRPGYNTPLGTVARFHLPIVRAYWNCGELAMLPSFISAAMTGICVDLRYVTMNLNKSRHIIIAKYWLRGYFSLVAVTDVPAVEKAIRKQYADLGGAIDANADPVKSKVDAKVEPKVDVKAEHILSAAIVAKPAAMPASPTVAKPINVATDYDDDDIVVEPFKPAIAKKKPSKVAAKAAHSAKSVAKKVNADEHAATVKKCADIVVIPPKPPVPMEESKIDQYATNAAVWPINSPIWTGECNKYYVNEHSLVSFVVDRQCYNRDMALNEFKWTSR